MNIETIDKVLLRRELYNLNNKIFVADNSQYATTDNLELRCINSYMANINNINKIKIQNYIDSTVYTDNQLFQILSKIKSEILDKEEEFKKITECNPASNYYIKNYKLLYNNIILELKDRNRLQIFRKCTPPPLLTPEAIAIETEQFKRMNYVELKKKEIYFKNEIYYLKTLKSTEDYLKTLESTEDYLKTLESTGLITPPEVSPGEESTNYSTKKCSKTMLYSEKVYEIIIKTLINRFAEEEDTLLNEIDSKYIFNNKIKRHALQILATKEKNNRFLIRRYRGRVFLTKKTKDIQVKGYKLVTGLFDLVEALESNNEHNKTSALRRLELQVTEEIIKPGDIPEITMNAIRRAPGGGSYKNTKRKKNTFRKRHFFLKSVSKNKKSVGKKKNNKSKTKKKNKKSVSKKRKSVSKKKKIVSKKRKSVGKKKSKKQEKKGKV